MPLTNVYGRRPIVLICLLFATAGSIGSALSPTFKVLLGTRVINGIGISGMMAVGNAVVNDIFFLHERGMKTGIFTVFLTNGAHVAVLCKLRDFVELLMAPDS
jgi:MFS family permease